MPYYLATYVLFFSVEYYDISGTSVCTGTCGVLGIPCFTSHIMLHDRHKFTATMCATYADLNGLPQIRLKLRQGSKDIYLVIILQKHSYLPASERLI